MVVLMVILGVALLVGIIATYRFVWKYEKEIELEERQEKSKDKK